MLRSSDDYSYLYREFRIVPEHGLSALVLRTAEHVGAVAAFSLRNGGDSPAPFDTLNFSSRLGDPPENIQRNFGTLAALLGVDSAKIVFPRQVHGDAVEILESSQQQPGDVDALITPVSGVYLAVKTADCVPLLLLDPERKIAAAVHAGWKGTLLRITRKTIQIMNQEFGTEPSRVLAAVGPSIGPCCYEVGDNVLNAFRRGFPAAEKFVLNGLRAAARGLGTGVWLTGDRVFRPQPVPGRLPESVSLRLDLVDANRAELVAAGVLPHNVHVIDLCTACYPELFFSHRRDRGYTGRQVAVVGFRA